jgi:hypothetical protein
MKRPKAGTAPPGGRYVNHELHALIARITAKEKRGDLRGALEEVRRAREARSPRIEEGFLTTMEISLLEELGEHDEAYAIALRDYEEKRHDAYGRYVRELTLGACTQGAGKTRSAATWLRRAVRTTLGDPTTSPGGAIRRLLHLGSPYPTKRDVQLCTRGLGHAWKVLRIAKPFDPENLERDLKLVLEAHAKPPSRPPRRGKKARSRAGKRNSRA